MAISTFKYRGKDFSFEVQNPLDEVQNFHLNGKFYEQDFLECTSKYIPRCGCIVDVGANVGNHTIWYIKNLDIATVVAFEPHPTARQLLRTNLELNGLLGLKNKYGGDYISEYHISENLALGDEPKQTYIRTPYPDNLGGSYLCGDGDYKVKQVRFDDVWGIETQIDFVKIDVEGMEFEVLKGFSNTIPKWRPSIAVEIHQGNKEKLYAWIKENQYYIVDVFIMYRDVYNYILLPW